MKKRPTAMVLSFTVAFVLLTIGLLLFGGWQWTSASNWFASPNSVPAQQEVIEAPDQQPLHPAELTPAARPTEALPATELLLNDALPANNLPELTPTTIPASGT